MSKVHPIHKNPAWFAVVPLWAWAVGGTATVATTAVVVNNSKLNSINEQIRNVQAIEDDLYADLASLRQGIQVDTSKSTTMVLAPSSEKVALLQEATAYRDAANHLIKRVERFKRQANCCLGSQRHWIKRELHLTMRRLLSPVQNCRLHCKEQVLGIATYGSDMTQMWLIPLPIRIKFSLARFKRTLLRDNHRKCWGMPSNKQERKLLCLSKFWQVL